MHAHGLQVENSEYVKFARRIMRSLSKRAGADIDTLPELRAIGQDIDDMMRRSVAACRAEGYSWAEIGRRLDITRQAAQQRYGAVEIADVSRSDPANPCAHRRRTQTMGVGPQSLTCLDCGFTDGSAVLFNFPAAT